MNELQLAGFGYKQSFGPLQPVLAISSLGHWTPGGGAGLGVVVVGGGGGRVVILPGHVEFWGQSHSFLLSFHSRPAGQGITTGFPDPSGCGTHCMNELQLAGFGYKQSFGPRQPVLAISSLGHWTPGGGAGLGVVVVGGGGRVVILPGHVESWGQSHSFLLSFHSRPAGQGITTGFPDPSGCGTHWINVLQLFGLGYKQSLGPIHFVAAISAREQTKFGGGGTGGRVGFGVFVVVGAELQVDELGQSHTFILSFH
jgi:hypothetical protein